MSLTRSMLRLLIGLGGVDAPFFSGRGGDSTIG